MTKRNPKQPLSALTLVLIIALMFFGGLVVFSLITNNTEALFSSVAILLSILCIAVPAIGLSRLIFQSRLGRSLQGQEKHYPIYSGKRFSFSVRRTTRPWWYYPLLFLFGWIVFALILVLMNY